VHATNAEKKRTLRRRDISLVSHGHAKWERVAKFVNVIPAEEVGAEHAVESVARHELEVLRANHGGARHLNKEVEVRGDARRVGPALRVDERHATDEQASNQ
jgi:hypothetical protein